MPFTPPPLGPSPALPMMFLPDALRVCVAAGTAWQQEVTQFVGRRLTEDMRSWQAVAAARDAGSLVKAQHDWCMTAVTDYAEEARRMQQLATTMSLGGTPPEVQESARLVG